MPNLECRSCGLASCDLPDGIEPELIFEGGYCQVCAPDHCDVCARPIHRYHGTSWLHDQPGIDDHLARPRHTHDSHDPQEAP